MISYRDSSTSSGSDEEEFFYFWKVISRQKIEENKLIKI